MKRSECGPGSTQAGIRTRGKVPLGRPTGIDGRSAIPTAQSGISRRRPLTAQIRTLSRYAAATPFRRTRPYHVPFVSCRPEAAVSTVRRRFGFYMGNRPNGAAPAVIRTGQQQSNWFGIYFSCISWVLFVGKSQLLIASVQML